MPGVGPRCPWQSHLPWLPAGSQGWGLFIPPPPGLCACHAFLFYILASSEFGLTHDYFGSFPLSIKDGPLQGALMSIWSLLGAETHLSPPRPPFIQAPRARPPHTAPRQGKGVTGRTKVTCPDHGTMGANCGGSRQGKGHMPPPWDIGGWSWGVTGRAKVTSPTMG